MAKKPRKGMPGEPGNYNPGEGGFRPGAGRKKAKYKKVLEEIIWGSPDDSEYDFDGLINEMYAAYVQALSSKDDYVRFNAAKDLMNRAFGRPVQSLEVETRGTSPLLTMLQNAQDSDMERVGRLALVSENEHGHTNGTLNGHDTRGE